MRLADLITPQELKSQLMAILACPLPVAGERGKEAARATKLYMAELVDVLPPYDVAVIGCMLHLIDKALQAKGQPN